MKIAFERQQELNRIRDGAMGAACRGLTTLENTVKQLRELDKKRGEYAGQKEYYQISVEMVKVAREINRLMKEIIGNGPEVVLIKPICYGRKGIKHAARTMYKNGHHGYGEKRVQVFQCGNRECGRTTIKA